ncbi:hypothetical protein P7C71_g5774, partial [Lecanoromycetidae sp. Uapishka_2]
MTPTLSSPLRMLILSPPGTSHPAFLRDISNHEIRTPYYSASIPIWRDEIPTSSTSISDWKQEWTLSEAGEVVRAIGAWLLCFKKPRNSTELDTIRTLLTTIHEVIEHHVKDTYATSEPLLLAVGMQQTMLPSLLMESEEWEDMCRDCGMWEWIDGGLDGAEAGNNGIKEDARNEFGEKVGLERLKEALEANEWDGGDPDTDALSDDLGLGENGFGAEAAQIERELMGLKMAVNSGANEDGSKDPQEEVEDESVEEMERMMLKIQAIKEMGADMPEEERRRFAAKAVRDVMKTI